MRLTLRFLMGELNANINEVHLLSYRLQYVSQAYDLNVSNKVKKMKGFTSLCVGFCFVFTNNAVNFNIDSFAMTDSRITPNDIERFCFLHPTLSDLLSWLWIIETREIEQFEHYCSTNCFFKSFPKAVAPSLRVFSCRTRCTAERYRIMRKPFPQWFTFIVK